MAEQETRATAETDAQTNLTQIQLERMEQEVIRGLNEALQEYVGQSNDENTQRQIVERGREVLAATSGTPVSSHAIYDELNGALSMSAYIQPQVQQEPPRNVRPVLRYEDVRTEDYIRPQTSRAIPHFESLTLATPFEPTEHERRYVGVLEDVDGDIGIPPHHLTMPMFVTGEPNQNRSVVGGVSRHNLTQEEISRRFYEALERRQQMAEATETPAETPAPTRTLEELETRSEEVIEQRHALFDEMDRVRNHLHDLLHETEHTVSNDLIEELETRYRELEARYDDAGEVLQDLRAEITALNERTNPEPAVTAGEVVGDLADTTIRNLNIPAAHIAADVRGNVIRTGQITISDMPPITAEPIRVEPIHVDGRNIAAGGITANTLDFNNTWSTWGDTQVSYTATWKPAKRYKFDSEKINNTMTMLRAFHAILTRYTFTEDEIKKMGIQDLVIEE